MKFLESIHTFYIKGGNDVNNFKPRIGYACINKDVDPNNYKTCRKDRITEENLKKNIEHNLSVLEKTVDYNIEHNNKMFRISSSLIPFGSSKLNTCDWSHEFKEQFERIRVKIRDNDIRISVHPGQYTVINSKNPSVVENSIEELQYHAKILDLLSTNSTSKMILHIGGVYEDKSAAMNRFIDVYKNRLDDNVIKYLVIENDDRLYTVADVLEISSKISVPVVFDNLHHETNQSLENMEMKEIMNCVVSTWNLKDGRPKVHYSQQAHDKRPGAHSETIDLDKFIIDSHYYDKDVQVDIMLEVKDKNRSFLKVDQLFYPSVSKIEREWARYQYWIMARSQRTYNQMRILFKDSKSIDIINFYNVIESLKREEYGTIGSMVNAFQHVWGYFKNIATITEKNKFMELMNEFEKSNRNKQEVYRYLYKLTDKYNITYLKNSYFFDDIKL